MKFHAVAALAQLAEGQGVAADIEGRPIVLVRSGETIYALDNLCTHSGARLDRGRVLYGVISCPFHGAKFALATGECRTPQMGLSPVVTHNVRIVDGYVEVALAAEPMTVPRT